MDNLSLVKELSKQTSINAITIDASCVHDFTHLGFNKRLEFNEFSTQESRNDLTSYREHWTNKVKSILLRSNVKCMFVRDQVDPDILEFCDLNSILVLKNFSYKNYKQLLDFYRCESLIYFEDFQAENVFQCKFSLIETDQLSNTHIKLESLEFNDNNQITTVLYI